MVLNSECPNCRGYGQAKILASAEIERPFSEGFQSDRDKALFRVCLYIASRIAEACSLMIKNIYRTPLTKF